MIFGDHPFNQNRETRADVAEHENAQFCDDVA